MKIIAFDPGYERLGIAILEKTSRKESLLFSECFITDKLLPHEERLHKIGQRVEELILQFNPDFASIEGLFFSKNTKTALKVAEARGVLIFLSQKLTQGVYEFTPNQIKLAVTGYGNSDKKSIHLMTSKLIKLPERKTIDDEIDAIACGLTFFAHQNTLFVEK